MTATHGSRAAQESPSPRAARCGGVGGAWIAVLAAAGGVAAALLATPAPAAPGAARLASAEVMLGAFDALWVLALAWPRSAPPRERTRAASLLLCVGLPFHTALGAAAGAGSGHAVALATLAFAAMFAGALAGRRALYPWALAAALLALPLVGYALTEFAGGDALRVVRASPLTAPVLLARRAAEVAATDGVAPAAALLVAALVSLLRRPPVLGVCAVATLLLAGSTALAETPRVEPVADGFVREGAPVVVRAPRAVRVRARGGPWSGPVGQRGDEFVLLSARPRGDVLDVDVEDASGAITAVEVEVRPLSARGGASGRGWIASLGSSGPEGPRDGIVFVRPVDLPTVPEAWLVFDDVVDVPDSLPSAAREALELAHSRPRTQPFEPALLPPAPAAFRAAARSAAAAPRLPGDVAGVLGVVAALVVGLVLVLRRAPATRVPASVWLAAPPLAAFAWVLLSGGLPGAVRAHAIVLETAGARVAYLRLSAVRPGDVTVALATPGAGGLVVPVRWGSDDAPPDGVGVGTTARLHLEAGRTALLAFRLPFAGRDADPAPERAGRRTGPAPAAIAEWLGGDGWRAVAVDADAGPIPVVLGGARLLGVQRFALLPAR